MNRFLCWLLGHRWREVNRRHASDLDHVEHRCSRCGEEDGGAEDLLKLKKRLRLF